MPPGRRSAADVARFQRALRSKRPPRTMRDGAGAREAGTRYDESGFALPPDSSGNLAARVRRALFTA